MNHSRDRELISLLIQTYFDSMFESSKEKVGIAFHPNAIVAGVFGEQFLEMNRDEFGKFVETKQPSAKENGEIPKLDVISIDIAGQTAVALVRDDYLGFTFLDTLSMVKTGERWVIYNKLFHIE